MYRSILVIYFYYKVSVDELKCQFFDTYNLVGLGQLCQHNFEHIG